MIGLLLLVAAFAAFALSSESPHRRVFARGGATPPRRIVRAVAWLLVALSLPFPLLDAGWVFGPVLWCGLLMLAAGLVFLALNLVWPDAGRR